MADRRVGIFSDDIVVQILAKLPVKSLIRFKTVCKAWCLLTSDDHFISLHLQNASRVPHALLIEFLDALRLGESDSILIDGRTEGVSSLSLDFIRDRVQIRASCEGLLCCASRVNRGTFYVCNPTTRKLRVLPRTRERPFTRFQPDYEATLVGLAADPVSRRYTVVLAGCHRPFGQRPMDRFICLMLHSGPNSTWNRFFSTCNDEFSHMNRNHAVFSSGMLHWLTLSCSYVLALDLRNESWMKIPLPLEVSAAAAGQGSRAYLLDLEGDVSVIQIAGIWMSIWVLRENVLDQWELLNRVHLKCIGGLAATMFPVSQTRETIFLASRNQVLKYGLKDKVWREIFSEKEDITYPLWFSAYPFRGTLFPLGE